jgi:RimJ/RimL family protein N-acetyltransferase
MPVTPPSSVQDIIDALAQEPLRHVVLLKQLLAYPEHVKVRRVREGSGSAVLVLLDTSASAYDRHAYPDAALAAFISSDRPELTTALLADSPDSTGIVFKLAHEDDVAPVRARFNVTRRTAFVSFTSAAMSDADSDVRVTSSVGESAYALFETQGHDRAWLAPLLRSGKAFAAVLEREDGHPLSACFAFDNYGAVWEVGGVVTLTSHRNQGLGRCVVRTALAELGKRALVPRYQVEEDNEPSIRLARSVGLEPFLTITHYAHRC